MTDSEELAYYRDINNRAQSDPEARSLLLALRKKLYPNSSIPEHDIPQKLKSELEAELKRRDEEFEQYKTQQTNKETLAEYTKRKEAAQAKYRFTDEDVGKIEKMIEEEQWPTLELAAQYYSKMTEPIAPGGLGLLGLSQTKGALEQRKEFNDRYRKIFRKSGSRGREVLGEALDKVKSGEYLNEIR